MAVVQISKIQARRGLQQDLPQLSSAELGWSVDQRRLFIGNGTIEEGAPAEGVTEVLTQYTDFAAVLKNYVFKGNAGGYTALTGTTLLTPSNRSYQDKLDDFVSVKDFGAKGDGTTDDTVAINRAIREIYQHISNITNTNTWVRRTIYFPAGTYIISGASILIPPYARLVGDGISNSVIKQTDSSQSSVITLTDSLFQTGSYLGNNSAVLPIDISISNIMFENTSDKDIANIDSANNVYFEAVTFKGSLVNPTTAGSQAYTAVRIKSFATLTNNINFNKCKLINSRYAVLSDDAGKNVRLSDCYITSVYKGIKLGENSSSLYPTAYRITNTLFDKVADRAIDTYAGVQGVYSSGNFFNDAGSNYTSGVTNVSSVINYVDNGNYSIGDNFGGKLITLRVTPVNSRTAWLEANLGLTLGTSVTGTGGNVTLLDNQSSPVLVVIPGALPNSASINYSIIRNTGRSQGTLQYTLDGATPYYVDTSTGPATDLGVTLGMSGNTLTYTTSSTGSAAFFRYNLNYFN